MDINTKSVGTDNLSEDSVELPDKTLKSIKKLSWWTGLVAYLCFASMAIFLIFALSLIILEPFPSSFFLLIIPSVFLAMGLPLIRFTKALKNALSYRSTSELTRSTYHLNSFLSVIALISVMIGIVAAISGVASLIAFLN